MYFFKYNTFRCFYLDRWEWGGGQLHRCRRVYLSLCGCQGVVISYFDSYFDSAFSKCSMDYEKIIQIFNFPSSSTTPNSGDRVRHQSLYFVCDCCPVSNGDRHLHQSMCFVWLLSSVQWWHFVSIVMIKYILKKLCKQKHYNNYCCQQNTYYKEDRSQ